MWPVWFFPLWLLPTALSTKRRRKRHKQQKMGIKKKKLQKHLRIRARVHSVSVCLYVSQKRSANTINRGEIFFKKSKEKHHCKEEVKTHAEKQAGKITKPTRTRRSTAAAATTLTKRHRHSFSPCRATRPYVRSTQTLILTTVKPWSFLTPGYSL